VGGTAKAFDEVLRRDQKRFEAALKKAGIKPE
jgi:hypothetical protein